MSKSKEEVEKLRRSNKYQLIGLYVWLVLMLLSFVWVSLVLFFRS